MDENERRDLSPDTPAEPEKELFQYDGAKPKKEISVGRSALRKFLPLIILGAALILLGAAYFILRALTPESDPKNDVNTVTVTDLVASDVKSVDIKNKSDSFLMYKKSGSVYEIKGKEDKDVDSVAIETAIDELSAVTSTKKIDVGDEKLAEYGLDKPQATVTLTTNTATLTFYIGDQSAGDDYYFYLSDDKAAKEGKKAVYLLDDTKAGFCLADHYYYYNTNLSDYDSSEDVEHISKVKIGGSKGTHISAYMSNGDEGLAYVMDEPVNMPFSTSAMDSLLSLMTTLADVTPIDDDVTAKNLTAKGLADPLYTFSFVNSSEQREIYFGNTEDGNIYCMKKGGNIIYKTEAAAVTAVLGLNIADMCDVITYTRNVDTVTHMRLTGQGKTYDITVNGTGEDRSVIINNKQAQSSIFSEFYAALLGIEVQREGTKPDKEPYLTLEITTTDGIETLRYYEADERYCFYEMNGKGMFYVSHQAVDALLDNAQHVYDNKEIVTAW